MRKTFLVFLTILSMASILSGCFCPYGHGWDGRGYYGNDRGYDGHRDGSREYRQRR